VAIDALAINSVPPGERGFLNGCMQAGMLTGRSVFGGGALFAAAWLGRDWMIGMLVAWIWISLPVALLLKEPAAREPVAARARELRHVLASIARSKTMWMGLAFALTSAAAFEATGQLAGPFLIDRGVPASTIGLFFGVFVVGAMLAGGLIGGRLSDRWGRLRSVAVFLAGFVAVIVALAAADLGGGRHPMVLMALLTAMYFFIGLFTAASYALFMDLTDPRLAGTQFSTFMAATNGCESWSALAGGRIAGSAGYPAAFLVMSVVSLLSLGLLGALRPRPTPSARP
jgi:MFS transporter (putative signal transducer)